MAKSNGIKKMFYIDYGNLGEADKVRVHSEFLEEIYLNKNDFDLRFTLNQSHFIVHKYSLKFWIHCR